MNEVDIFFESLPDEELISSYNKLLRAFKSRNMIRTNNLIGDLGEFIAMNHYNSSDDLPNLVLADPNERAFDAYDRDDDNVKFAIKSTSTNMTGIFWGLEGKDSEIVDRKILDYVIIVKFSTDYQLESIYQIDWDTFLELKSWHSTTKAWKINITNKLRKCAVNIYSNQSE